MSDADSDDFGDFDDFDEFEGPVDTELVSGIADVVLTSHEQNMSSEDAVAPINLAEAQPQIEKLLAYTPAEPLKPSRQRFTHTAEGLWHQLMEDPNATFIQWEGSTLQRRLVQSFGVPLNLDYALPKASTRSMSFETVKSDMEHIPKWTMLSLVSEQALNGMNEQETKNHIGELDAAIREAKALQETLENHEMDLLGEKDVLEGMVESLLAYSQKSQRNQLKVKK